MKHLLLTTIAAVLLVGCGESQQTIKKKAISNLFSTNSPILKKRLRDLELRLAASKGNIETVKQLLAAGRDVNAKNNKGETPLHGAAKEGHKEIAELLITKGADVNARDEYGYTPLFMRLPFGAAAGHKEIIELLNAKGADVNARGKYGLTPLHWAVFGKYKETAKLLIAKDADVNALSNKGDAPLDLAKGETADLLRKHGGKTGAELK